MQNLMMSEMFASSTAMGPIMPQLKHFLIKFPGCIAPAIRCAVVPHVSGRRGFQTARLDLSKNKKTYKNRIYSYIVTGHHFCKTPPAGTILLGRVLLLSRICTLYAFLNIRASRFSRRNCYKKSNVK